jgi:WXG100 family type VII secretion target
LTDQTQAEAQIMAQAANTFRSTNSDLANLLKQLMTELDGLRGGWKGAGAQAFDAARTRWSDDMRTLHQALDETATAIETAGRSYTSSDDESARRLNATHGAAPVNLPL